MIEFVDHIVIMSGCRCMNLHDGDNEITALKQIEIILLETGRQPIYVLENQPNLK